MIVRMLTVAMPGRWVECSSGLGMMASGLLTASLKHEIQRRRPADIDGWRHGRLNLPAVEGRVLLRTYAGSSTAILTVTRKEA